MVELAQIQDREVGDGTTSVVLLAAEILKVRFCFVNSFAEEELTSDANIKFIIKYGYSLVNDKNVS